MIRAELLFLIAAAVLLLSVFASKFAVRSGIPALLLFLVIGMLAGSDGPGGIYFDDPWLSQSVGVLALAFILFSGGLDTQWNQIRPVLASGLALSTFGVLITTGLMGLFAHLAFELSLLEGLLLGAIVSSTDAAAVFSILRGKGVRLRDRLSQMLEMESGSNDPMAVFLTIGLIQLLRDPSLSALSLLPLFAQQMGLGFALGIGLGLALRAVVNRLNLEYDGLYPVLTISGVLLIYGATAMVGGNGFLAVYLAGLIMGSGDFIHKRSLVSFHDGLAWLVQITMFLTLGLQVFPSEVIPLAGDGLLAALFLIAVARPASVFIALAFSPLTIREKLLIAWVGLRGAAPIVLATFPQLAGLAQGDVIFNLVFFIVLTSVLLQGTLIIPAAKLLRVYEPDDPHEAEREFASARGRIGDYLTELIVPHECVVDGKRILDLGLPPGVLIVLIGRGEELFVPGGATLIRGGDSLLLLADQSLQEDLMAWSAQMCVPLDAPATP
jgi:cell volume regulation protein A